MPETLKIDGKMNVHIISPIRTVLDGVADKILLPTCNGDMMILKNRAPLFIATRPGLMWVYNAGQRPQAFYISGGVVELRRNICSVLAWGVDANKVDKVKIHERRLNLEEELGKIHSDAQRSQVQERIEFFKMLETKPSLLVPPNFE
ncbi:MAG: F0F1 ATP synthase subunit epsilon [Alphaproteobacteria bacterium]|nr:F0F1 ATP synthase subunit epsilon [Alphaproteobacteria bacterium]